MRHSLDIKVEFSGKQLNTRSWGLEKRLYLKIYMKGIKSHEIIWNPKMNPKHSRVKKSVDEGDFQKHTKKKQPVS